MQCTEVLHLSTTQNYLFSLQLTWSVFRRNSVFESVDDDSDDGERQRQRPAEQRVDDELLPLGPGAQSKLSCCKLEMKAPVV